MTTATRATPTASTDQRGHKAAKAAPFDPYTATYEGEEYIERGNARLAFRCPSRREPVGYLLTCREDGNRPSCSCDGYAYRGECTHTKQAETIARLTLTNLYATMREDDLAALDRTLARRGYGAGSIRSDVLADELAKRARMKDQPALNLRGQRAKMELFG